MAACVSFLASSTAQAAPYKHTHITKWSLSDAKLGKTPQELLAQKDHSTDVLQFFLDKHSWMMARRQGCDAVPWHRTCRISRAQVRLHRWLRQLAVDRYAALFPVWPPHHLLWLCIHRFEGSWNNEDTGHNGHYGGLQMHPGWGYGTSYHASNDSQFTQEWAAERGYIASHYSHTWLLGQWYHPSCLKHA